MQDPLEKAGIEVANRMISSPLPMTGGLGANFFVSNGRTLLTWYICVHMSTFSLKTRIIECFSSIPTQLLADKSFVR